MEVASPKTSTNGRLGRCGLVEKGSNTFLLNINHLSNSHDAHSKPVLNFTPMALITIFN